MGLRRPGKAVDSSASVTASGARADHLVHALEEGDGLEVLAPAVLRWDPLAGLAAVVAVEHGGDRVDAQAVDAVALQPVQRIADQEVAHLGAAEVVDQRIPGRVEALARVGVFVQVRAVEARQSPVLVGGEVRRHPVEDQADARRGSVRRSVESPRIAEA